MDQTVNTELMTGFYKLPRAERLTRLKQLCDLSVEDLAVLSGDQPFDTEIAENLIENVVGTFSIPLGVATHFNIDGRDVLIPMAVEETSIVAASSATAKWVRQDGSITTEMKGRLIIGQIQIPYPKSIENLKTVIHRERFNLIQIANDCFPSLVDRGGGVRDIIVRDLGEMAVIHVNADPCDAMGANMINQVCEILKPHIESLTGERVGLCILSNLMDGRIARAELVIRGVDSEVARGVEEAARFAKADPYRAATHNKGVMNGIDPVIIATGNDWRAVEAGVHAYAARSGRYQPVTDWKAVETSKGWELHGSIEVPMQVGVVGGVTRVHPTAKVALKMMGVKTAEELARICVAVGLVQNLGALKALATVGIVSGHMKLHATNLAIAAGAELHEVHLVREALGRDLLNGQAIGQARAKEILEQIRERERKRDTVH